MNCNSIPPASINARANIAALRRVGCTQVLSVSAVGSLAADVPPGHFVLIDQFIDRTLMRDKTFFGPGLVGHVPFGEPVCGRMRAVLAESALAADVPARDGGTYVVMEGPQFCGACRCGCDRALDTALMTAPAQRDPRMFARLLTVAPNAQRLLSQGE